MPKRSAFVTLAAIDLEAGSTLPLYRQLYAQLRQAVLSRRLLAGTRLPPTRALAEELAVSRNTVVNAFEQLIAEGYLDGKIGSGTYVAHSLGDETLGLRGRVPAIRRAPSTRPEAVARRPGASRPAPHLSPRGAAIAAGAREPWAGQSEPCAFEPGVPALASFPTKLWSLLAARQWRGATSGLLGYGDPAGYAPLREALAAYLGASRGVLCVPEQVIIVAGSQQATDLAVRLLLDRGDEVWVEDPGYLDARSVVAGAGALPVAVPVDEDGLDLEKGKRSAPRARMVYVSPSHQFPLGVRLSLARRLALLEWANRSQAWIVEDDYDSEYRYVGRPLAALQGLDQAGRVIYVGTFSEVLFPSLRLGYMVVPRELVESFVTARALADRHSPLVEQAIVAEFIRAGHFARHIRRMRELYAERRAVLVEAIERELADWLTVSAEPAGLHFVAWLCAGLSDKLVSQRLATKGVSAPPLSRYALAPLARAGLVLGYGGVDIPQIHAGVRVMKNVLESLTRR